MIEQYANRLLNVPDFDIYKVQSDGKVSDTPDRRVVMAEVVKDLILNEATLSTEVMAVAGQIMYWGRWAGRAQRIYEVTERQYRIWRDTRCLTYLKRDEEDPKWKKPTKDEVERRYRTEPEYEVWQRRIEEATETYNACKAIHEAFKAKKDVITRAIVRVGDGSQSRLVI